MIRARNDPTPEQSRAFRLAWATAPRRTAPTPEERAARCVEAMTNAERSADLVITIFAADDAVNRAAAISCARRWRAAGSAVSIRSRDQIMPEADTPLVRTEGLSHEAQHGFHI